MGTWGSALYQNDSTCDVRDTYIELLQDGLSNNEAYERTIEKFKDYIGDDDEPFLWFALAETQWKVGRLTPNVQEKALEWIEKKGGIDLWLESSSKGAGWEKTINSLKEKLLSPMPKEKKVRKPKEVTSNMWEVNDVYAYQFHGKGTHDLGIFGKYMLLQKIGEEVYKSTGKTLMRIQLLDKLFDELPTIDDIENLRILPVDNPIRVNISKDYQRKNSSILSKKDPIWMSALMDITYMREYPKKHLTFIGNRQGPLNLMSQKRKLNWVEIDNWLYKFYQRWEGIEYDNVIEGVYDFIKD